MKAKNQLNDPVLRNLIQQIDPPKAPAGFNQKVMNSIRVKTQKIQTEDRISIPGWIKFGVPAFIALCSLLIIVFPGDQSSAVDLFIKNFSDSEILDFFNQINLKLESAKLPVPEISSKVLLYSIAGIGLIWMFIISERISRRFKKI